MAVQKRVNRVDLQKYGRSRTIYKIGIDTAETGPSRVWITQILPTLRGSNEQPCLRPAPRTPPPGGTNPAKGCDSFEEGFLLAPLQENIMRNTAEMLPSIKRCLRMDCL